MSAGDIFGLSVIIGYGMLCYGVGFWLGRRTSGVRVVLMRRGDEP